MEILAPAGNLQKFFAGLKGGADGLYLGLEKFSARGSAGNFNSTDLQTAFMAAKLYQKKIYIAINTLLLDNEIPQVIDLLTEIAPYQPAGIIIQDLALIKIIKEQFPALPLVASTQMSVHNLSGALFLEELGFDQAVLARELSFEEIAYIKANSNIKLEIFIHGAMCFSYSGQCLFSSMIGGRSGNRGQCAQICRKKFQLDNQKSGCLLSPQDMDGTEFVRKLAEIGITTAKIEGRMRSPQYVYAAADYYKTLLADCPATEISAKKFSLQIAFDRGSSSGYFRGKNNELVNPESAANHGLLLGAIKLLTADKAVIARKSAYQLKKGDGLAVKTAGRTFGFVLQQEPENSADEIIISEQIGQFKKESEIFVTSEAALNHLEAAEPKIGLSIQLLSVDKILKVTLPELKKEFELPLDIARSEQDFNAFLTKKITNFEYAGFEFIQISVCVEKGLFLAYSQLREKLLTVLDDYQTEFKSSHQSSGLSGQIKPLRTQFKKNSLPELVFIVHNQTQFDLAVQQKLKLALDFEFYHNHADKAIFAGQNYQLLLPPMIKDKHYAVLADLASNILPVCSNIGEVNYFKKSGRKFASSFHLNIANSQSAEMLFAQGGEEVELSLESDLTDFDFKADRRYSLRVFGEFLVMTTEYCLVKNNHSCSECHQEHKLLDERNAVYRVQTNSLCQNTISYHTPLFLGSTYQQLLKYPLSSWMINLGGLDLAACKDVVTYFSGSLRSKNFADRILGRQFKKFNGRYRLD